MAADLHRTLTELGNLIEQRATVLTGQAIGDNETTNRGYDRDVAPDDATGREAV